MNLQNNSIFLYRDLFDLSKDNIQIKEIKSRGIILPGVTEVSCILSQCIPIILFHSEVTLLFTIRHMVLCTRLRRKISIFKHESYLCPDNG